MSHTLQDFLAEQTPKVLADLIEAVQRIPEEKLAWSPMGDARTVLDQLAECALLNGSSADMLTAKSWTMGSDLSPYLAAKAKLAEDATACIALLKDNTGRVIDVIKEVKDDDLDVQVQMPWGANSIAEIASYPYWNMYYHQGQINYIASMLGRLD